MSCSQANIDCSNKIINRVQTTSESQSDVSSNDTEVSESIIAAKLGVTDFNLVRPTKIKIDRQKLENMIQNEDSQGRNQAEIFFSMIQQNTMTHINWPSRLKVNAKSKKDVHVNIYGLESAIKSAKERVLELLDPRGSRVTMKIDISYTDHSYIIGIRGENIKKIMGCTNTHIHFPDSNRGNAREKKNQVSLTGTLEGVEKARALVRATAPLIISFELPFAGHEYSPISSSTDQYVNRVRETFNVEVSFSNKQKLNNTLVSIKSSEKNATNVKDATQILINRMCQKITSPTKVNLQLEISPHLHESVKGKNCMDLRNIMSQTQTEIMFSDVRDVNIQPLKKSQVIITGSIDGVYKARQQLIGNLPVTLSFDYGEFPPDLDINSLSNKYGVIICPQLKAKNSCIQIRGKEKFIEKMYEARHELLKLTTAPVKAEVPETYYSPMELKDEFAYRKNGIYQQQNTIPRFDSPITPNLTSQSLGNHLDVLQNYNSPYSTRFANIHQSPQTTFNTSLSPHSSLQPRSTLSPRTSGYNSSRSSNNSLDQLSQSFHQQCLLDAHSAMKDNNNNLFDDERTPTMLDVQNVFNFDKKIENLKAIRGLDLDEKCIRTPTNTWAGFGLSRTSPFTLESMRKSLDWDRNEASPYNNVRHTTNAASPAIGQHADINSLLIQLGLEHYITTFRNHEVDLDLFMQLTPDNLTSLGIQAFGARKKILMAINQLNASKNNLNRLTKFSGSAAPGAERRISGDW